MKAGVSKQYLSLAGKPILAHTIALFEYHPQVDHVYLIVPGDDIAYCRERIVAPYGFTKIDGIVAGGDQRQDSVLNGLKALARDGLDQPERPILVHDGARPLFDTSLLTPLIDLVCRRGACAVGVPVKDTIKDVEDSQIMGSPDRSRLWQAQTPQAFQYGLLKQAFDLALRDGFRGTDDASLVERTGHRVQMLEGDYRNIKVTTPEDLLIAAALLEGSGRGV
jgi:2-C-methyl-D-erythritol 4-phosphate cytidylyltransferase